MDHADCSGAKHIWGDSDQPPPSDPTRVTEIRELEEITYEINPKTPDDVSEGDINLLDKIK